MLIVRFGQLRPSLNFRRSGGRNDPNALYFAKIRLGPATRTFSTQISGNTEAGVREGRFVLVAAPSADADKDLSLSLASDKAHDNRYPDSRRTRLQLDITDEIASSADLKQRCVD